MTGQEFYDYCLKTFKRTDKTTEVYQAITDTIMNVRIRFLSEEVKQEAYANLANIGEYKISMPDDFGHLIGDITVQDTATEQSYPPLVKISKERYDQLYFDRILATVANRHTGVPQHFCFYGREVFVGPAVDKTTYRFQINYTTEDAVEITAATADVPFSDRHRKTLRYGVMKELYLMLENYQEASNWDALYERDVNLIIQNDMANIKDNMPIQYHGI